jgi:phospholipid-binding lipoprotein MlaA
MDAAIRALAGALLLASLAGCATTNMGTPGDPLERMNRATHRFNSSIDRAVLRPVAVAYRDHVPRVVQTGVNNFLDNLAFTTTIANDLLQLKVKDTLIDLGRFALNSTLGLAGIFDPASDFGIPRNDEDFGQTLGRWGVPSGPYVVLPFLGPSTVRDGPSIFVDAQTDLRVALHINNNVEWALAAISFVNRRAELLPFDASYESAFDQYAFVRDAWLQRREYQVRDGEVEDEIPLEELEEAAEDEALEDAAEAEEAAPSAQPPETESPPETGEPPATQPPEAGASSSATSLIPASEASAGGTFR